MEIWKDIPGYEGLYQASSFGRIKTCENKVTRNARYSTRVWKSRIMKGRGNRYATGKRVSLWKDGKSKDYLVARLVALTFLGESPKDYTVNHKDGNRLNNNIENLEWISRGDNVKHAFSTGLMSRIQKGIVLKDDSTGNVYEFNSYSECSRFLGRNHGYVSHRYKNNHLTMLNNEGRTFRVLPF
jgi:hypothetical protein